MKLQKFILILSFINCSISFYTHASSTATKTLRAKIVTGAQCVGLGAAVLIGADIQGDLHAGLEPRKIIEYQLLKWQNRTQALVDTYNSWQKPQSDNE